MAKFYEDLLLLFDRPGETLLTPKGKSSTIFELSSEFIPNAYRKIGLEIIKSYDKICKSKVMLKMLKIVPSFPKASKLPFDADFSLFLPLHLEMADEVIRVLMDVPEDSPGEFLSTCVYARANLNSQLFNYCYSVALMHRNDTRNAPIKNYVETFPFKFIDSIVFLQARESATLSEKGAPPVSITIPRNYTASDLDVEHRLAYFREDIGVNLHHWHWHLVYPTRGSMNIVNKDRRGELFYYMHQQIIARYNSERLDNSLARVKNLSKWRDPVPQAYFSKLDSLTSSRSYPPREANMFWQDIDRPSNDLNVTIADMERWRYHITEAIDTGLVTLPDGSTRELDIDTLGNMVEASMLSPNQQLYGNLHNNGHNMSAFMHDPKDFYLETHNVMGDVATAMRDPIFYRWHGFIDDLFQSYKQSIHVKPYEPKELENPCVTVTSLAIESSTGEKNELNTFWMTSDVDMSRGLDFAADVPVYVRFTHLNHRPFRYVINVNCESDNYYSTVRLFLGPKYDERKLPWMLHDQRKMFIEMDRFIVQLKKGPNTITRNSTESSVTIPFEQTFPDMSADAEAAKSPDVFNYCGCGWPQHMLVPKGTEGGAPYQLFVMLSNYEMDKVKQTSGVENTCVDASSYCGLKDKLYPDKRAMGFPFDRPSHTVSTIEKFILPNMAITDITIRFKDITECNPKNVCK